MKIRSLLMTSTVLLAAGSAAAQPGPTPPVAPPLAPPLPPSPAGAPAPASPAPTPPAAPSVANPPMNVPPASKAPPPAGPTASAGASVSFGSGGAPSEPDAGESNRRVVVFKGGSAPKLEAEPGRLVRGALDLEVRFEGVSPLCYRYHVTGADPSGGLPPKMSSDPLFASAGGAPATFADPKAARDALQAARQELARVVRQARQEVSLEAVWMQCDAGGGDPASRRTRVEKAVRAAASGVGSGGAWTRAIAQAENAASGARKLAQELGANARGAKNQARRLERELERAEQAHKAALANLENARFGRAKQEAEQAVDAAASDAGRVETELRAARQEVRAAEQARQLGKASHKLMQKRKKAVRMLTSLVGNVARAEALLANSPTSMHRHYGAGDDVKLSVKRTRLRRGRHHGGHTEVYNIAPYETLSPILIDVSFGASLAIPDNTKKYGLTFGPRNEGDNVADFRVHRTEDGLDLDAVAFVSAYVWKERYLDDTVFDVWQLIPRPLVGFSLVDPLETIYVGASIDPLQFVDISGGVRFKVVQELIGPQVGDPALRNATGEPVDPVTRREVQPEAFVAVTFSTDLVHRWIARGVF